MPLNLFRRTSLGKDIVGVQVGVDGVALTQVKAHSASSVPEVLHSEWLPEAEPQRQGRLLEKRVEQRGLKRKPCHLVLSREDYNLLLIEAPLVPERELRDAVRWRIRDLIDFPAEEAVLDAFLLSEDRRRGGKRMAYVAVARRERICQRIAQVQEARLHLKVIDIPELALRNLVLNTYDTTRGVALVKLEPGSGSLYIVRGDDLHLARRFNSPYAGGLLDGLPAEAFVLEVQRSLDYFERQMRQPPPGHIYLTGENVTEDKITDAIRESLPVPTSLFEPSLALADSVQKHTLPLCLDALGAALRVCEGRGEVLRHKNEGYGGEEG